MTEKPKPWEEEVPTTLKECVAYAKKLRKVASKLVDQAHHWKMKYEDLEATPNPGTHALTKRLQTMDAMVKEKMKSWNQALSEHRKDNAFHHGMLMREADEKFEDITKKYPRAADMRAAAQDGWECADRLIRKGKR